MTISERVIAYLKEQPGSAKEIGDALGLNKRNTRYGPVHYWGGWSFAEAENKGIIEYKNRKWHLTNKTQTI